MRLDVSMKNLLASTFAQAETIVKRRGFRSAVLSEFKVPSEIQRKSSGFRVPSEIQRNLSEFSDFRVPSETRCKLSEFRVPSEIQRTFSEFRVPFETRRKLSKFRVPSEIQRKFFEFRVPSETQPKLSEFRVPSEIQRKLSEFRVPSETQPKLSEFRVPSGKLPEFKKEILHKRPGNSRFQNYKVSRGGGYERPETAIWALLAANVAVYGLWQIADPTFMFDHFTVFVDNLLDGRIHTLVTNCFSQSGFWHLASNMLGLYVFGTDIAYRFGRRKLYLLYFAGGLFCSLGHLVYSYYIFPTLQGVSPSTDVASFVPPALGASGAVNTLVILNILLEPRRIIYVDLLFPVPALLGAYIVLKDLWGVSDVNSSVGHAGHLGGALVGLLAWTKLRRRPW